MSSYAAAELMKEKMDSAISQQVALLGSQRMYDRINKNMEEGKFEFLFAKVKLPNLIIDEISFSFQEHLDLFDWRYDYFLSQFGGCPDADKDSFWFTDTLYCCAFSKEIIGYQVGPFRGVELPLFQVEFLFSPHWQCANSDTYYFIQEQIVSACK